MSRYTTCVHTYKCTYVVCIRNVQKYWSIRICTYLHMVFILCDATLRYVHRYIRTYVSRIQPVQSDTFLNDKYLSCRQIPTTDTNPKADIDYEVLRMKKYLYNHTIMVQIHSFFPHSSTVELVSCNSGCSLGSIFCYDITWCSTNGIPKLMTL